MTQCHTSAFLPSSTSTNLLCYSSTISPHTHIHHHLPALLHSLYIIPFPAHCFSHRSSIHHIALTLPFLHHTLCPTLHHILLSPPPFPAPYCFLSSHPSSGSLALLTPSTASVFLSSSRSFLYCLPSIVSTTTSSPPASSPAVSKARHSIPSAPSSHTHCYLIVLVAPPHIIPSTNDVHHRKGIIFFTSIDVHHQSPSSAFPLVFLVITINQQNHLNIFGWSNRRLQTVSNGKNGVTLSHTLAQCYSFSFHIFFSMLRTKGEEGRWPLSFITNVVASQDKATPPRYP